jgi:hypothetical protein
MRDASVGDARSRRSATTTSAFCIRRGQVHGLENRGSVHAKFLAIATPARSDPPTSATSLVVLAAAAGGTPDLAAIGEVMRRHGPTPA